MPSAVGSRKTGGGLRLGIGDDAAVIAPNRNADWVLSCDAFIEGVHFLVRLHPPDSIGYKSLIRAASDLAAMGATPRLFLLTLALPAAKTGAWLDRFLEGMGRAARSLRMRLAGGDTTKNPRIAISITVLGEVKPGRAVTRSGARPGDIIYVSGRLGRAQLGLELVKRGFGKQRRLADVLRPHLYPRIRVALARWLADRGIASAMMDLSDGLSTDLARLAAASGVGARLQAGTIPCVAVPPVLSKHARGSQLDPMQLALHGGEDYELLFSVPRRKIKLLRGAPGAAELTPIGEITREKRIVLVGSGQRETLLRSQGWDPFRKHK